MFDDGKKIEKLEGNKKGDQLIGDSKIITDNFTEKIKGIIQKVLDDKVLFENDLLFIQNIKNINIFTEQDYAVIISNIIGPKDNETLNHTHRVGDLSSYLAKLIGNDVKFVENIKYASLIHDIGKMKVPSNILFNPGKLNESEFKIMQKHTIDGAKLIDKLVFLFSNENFFQFIKNIALYHHEKFDGTGYPEGLKGKEIPLESRIVTITDVFDALKSKRLYKPVFNDELVKQILDDGMGKHFDPEILSVF